MLCNLLNKTYGYHLIKLVPEDLFTCSYIFEICLVHGKLFAKFLDDNEFRIKPYCSNAYRSNAPWCVIK